MAAHQADAVTEFTKTKMHFALALLGTLFALHNFVDRFGEYSFDYLGYALKLYYPYAVTAALLGLTVYFYGLAMMSERGFSWMEKTGNFTYAIAIMVFPVYGGLYLSSLAAKELGQEHLAWMGPTVVPLALGVFWLLGSYILAWRLRKRLGDRDHTIKAQELAEHEIAALNRSREMFDSDHYDLAVIEAWKALQLRLRRVLLARGNISRDDNPDALIRTATRKGLLSKPALALLEELRRHWAVAVSVEPLTREAADMALSAARGILSTIPIDHAAGGVKPVV